MADKDPAPYTDEEQWRPTTTLGLAGLIAVFGVASSLAASNLGGMLLSLPFVLYVVWGWVCAPRGSRPAQIGPRGPLSAPDPALVTFRFTAQDDAPRIMTVVMTGNPSVAFTPTFSSVTGHNEVTIEARPYRWGRTTVGGGMLVEFDPSLCWVRERSFSPIVVNVRPSMGDMRGPSGIVAPAGISGTHVSRRVGEGTDLADIRPFRPGDSRRHVNWKVTARRQELHVTTSYTERDTDVVFIADTTISTESGNSKLPTSMDLIARAVSTVSLHYLSLGDRVALHDIGLGVRPVPYGSGRLQFRRIVDSLATMEQSPHVPERIAQYRDARPRQLAFLCTPLLSQFPVTESLRLQRLGIQVVVIDVLPPHLGDDSHAAWPTAFAWRYKRVERKADLEILQSVGIPIVAWHGPQSLTGLLLLLEHQRRAPKKGVAR